MKLSALKIQNFSVVRSGTLSFSPQVNVLIGRNGAGKSHVLKLLYSMLRAHRDLHAGANEEALEPALKAKLAGVFRPDDEAVGRLVSRGRGRNKATIQLDAQDGPSCKFTLSTLGR